MTQNYTINCPYCNKEFRNSAYHLHLINIHKSEIFKRKNNLEELIECSNKKETSYPSPLELRINNKIQYFVPCCNKFYTKDLIARKHFKNKECRDRYITNSKELLNSLPTNSITNNSNIDIIELNKSLSTIFIQMINTIETLRTDIVIQKRKDKDIDDNKSIDSFYDYNNLEDDDDIDIMIERFDIEKRFNAKILQPLKKYNISISRESLNLSTEEYHEIKKENKKQQLKEQQEELKADIDMIHSRIKNLKENISDREQRISDIKSGVPEKDYKYIQDDINKLLNSIKNFQNEIKESEIELKGLKKQLI